MSEKKDIIKKWKLDNGLIKVEVTSGQTGETIGMILVEATGKIWSGNETQPGIWSNKVEIFTNEKAEIHSRIGPAIKDLNTDEQFYYIDSKKLTKEEFLKHPDVMNFTKSLIDLNAKPLED